MGPIELGLLAIGVTLFLSLVGVPVGVAMVLTACGGMMTTIGERFMWSTLKSLPYDFASQYTFVVVPMFVLMGVVSAKANIIQDLYGSAAKWMAGLRGGLYGATVFASAGFSAISGSTVVNSTVFGKVAMPEMLRHGCHKGFSAASIAAAGTLAGLIPPSLGFVIYGILTGESIGRLLMAGILPGIVTAVAYLLVIAVVVRIRPEVAPDIPARYSLTEKLLSLRSVWPILVLAALVIGGIYLGFMPPSAAGAVGATGAIALALLRRSISRADLVASFHDTMMITGTLCLVVIGGLLLSRFFVISGFIRELTDVIEAMDLGVYAFILIVICLYLVLGMFIDTLSMVVVTLPVLYPLSQDLGMDGIWFAVIVVKLVEISAITPPVGLNLFAVMSASETPIGAREIYAGILPFILVEMFILLLLVAVPALSVWLPAQMIG
ncbi:TRAP transporter large permease [Sedimentitalea sp. XS_ASV28]|uniref:TRAP transporter large permease n=1 Tax=Sedimentitalea sp. XS_ASV28 TaxID=3241296 RepID=UPI0035174CDD